MGTKQLVAVLLLCSIVVLNAVPTSQQFEILDASYNELCLAPSPSIVPKTCQDVRNNGNRGSGIYFVQKPEGVTAVFCDMSALPVKESSLGIIGVHRSSSWAFYLSRNSSFNKGGVVTYDVVHLNEGGVADPESGVFTVPVNGIYFISFTGNIERTGSADSSLGYAFLRVNGVSKAIALHGVVKTKISLSLAVTIQLKKGDRVNVWLEWEKEPSRLFDNEYYPYTQFTGFLVRELPEVLREYQAELLDEFDA